MCEQDFSWLDPLFKQLGDGSHADIQEIVVESLIQSAVGQARNYSGIGRIARALDICNSDGLTIRLATTLRKVRQASLLGPMNNADLLCIPGDIQHLPTSC